MSDSDNTEILLQVTSDFFIKNNIVNCDKKHKTIKSYCEYNMSNVGVDLICRQEQQQIKNGVATTTQPTTSVYQFLSPRKKVELNHINTRIHNMICDERERQCTEGNGGTDGGGDGNDCALVTASCSDVSNSDGNNNGEKRFVCGSEISTISTHTVEATHKRLRNDNLVLLHSTPKGSIKKNEPINCGDGRLLDENVLQEIDSYLERHCSDHYKPNDDNYRLDKQQNCYEQHCIDGSETSTDMVTNSIPAKVQLQPQESKHLISLSDIWGGGRSNHISVPQTNSSTSLKEEQLRRQHLEKTVHSLQTRLLEYQQRISVAIEVDRTKDEALRQAEMEMKSLNIECNQIRNHLESLELEKRDYYNNIETIQKDLTQAVGMVAKFQEKSEQLEVELSSCTKKCNESSNLYKKQIEELEVKLHGSKKSEEFTNNELMKLKDRLAKAEYESDKFKMRSADLEKENNNLKHQKENLFDTQQKQRVKVEAFETQKKQLQETIAKLTENEEKQKKRFDLQQKSLKSHYQQQLEKVVATKMKEFQERLDKNESDLRQSATERERLLAERSVKQLEMINDKSELELRLLHEKHTEEVELYRLQLANASKTILELEEKLNGYKSKRADIAEKLHKIMEMQWQKALEILTSPNQTKQNDTTVMELDSPNNCNELVLCDKNDENNFTTPKSNRNHEMKANNLALVKNHLQAQPLDKLQAYIELLLSKSPSDLEKLDEILLLTESNTKTNAATKSEKSMKRNSNTSTYKYNDGKPPWKAC